MLANSYRLCIYSLHMNFTLAKLQNDSFVRHKSMCIIFLVAGFQRKLFLVVFSTVFFAVTEIIFVM